MVMRVMGSESKPAMLMFFVLKPPVALTLKAWLMASKGPIPASM